MTISVCRWHTCMSNYLFGIFHRSSAVAPWVARLKCTLWWFVKAAHHWLAAAQWRRTHLRVHCETGTRKAVHAVRRSFRQSCIAMPKYRALWWRQKFRKQKECYNLTNADVTLLNSQHNCLRSTKTSWSNIQYTVHLVGVITGPRPVCQRDQSSTERQPWKIVF